MKKSITAKTGNAQVDKLGHTSTNKYGQDPFLKDAKRSKPQDRSAK